MAAQEMDEKQKLKNSIVSQMRSVINSVKESISLKALSRDYAMIMGCEIPFRRLGYNSLAEFVRSEPAFKTKTVGNDLFVDVTIDSKTGHITELVRNQKSSKKPKRMFNFYDHSNKRRPVPSRKWTPKASSRYQKRQPNVNQHIQSQISVAPVSQKLQRTSSMPVNNYQNGNDFTKAIQKIEKKTPTTPTVINQSHFRGPDEYTMISNNKSILRKNSAPILTQQNNTVTKQLSLNDEKKEGPSSSLTTTTTLANPLVNDPIKNIPKELLKDVPHTNIAFHDILSRVKNDEAKTKHNSELIIDDISNRLKMNSLSDSSQPSSPAFMEDAVGDNEDIPNNNSSNKSKVWNDGSSPSPWSDSKKHFSTAPLISRGRGRLLSNISSPNMISTDFNFTPVPNVVPSFTEAIPVAEDERELRRLIAALDINAEPIIKITGRQPKHGQSSYFGQIKIGLAFNYSSFPTEYPTRELARMAIIQTAEKELTSRLEKISQLPVSAPVEIGPRLVALIEPHPTGIWADTVEQQYRQKHSESLPPNWLMLAVQNSVKLEYAANARCILLMDDATPSTNGVQSRLSRSLIRSSSLITIPEPEMLTQGVMCEAVITCVISASDVRIRLIGKNNSQQYKQLLTDMEQCFKNFKQPVDPSEVCCGGCYAIFAEDSWMRVRVIQDIPSDETVKSGQEVMCSLVDQGSEFMVNVDNFYVLPVSFIKLPAQAIRCKLAGLEDLSNVEFVKDLVEEFIGMYLFIEVLKVTEIPGQKSVLYNVILCDTSEEIDRNVIEEIIIKFCSEAATPVLVNDNEVQEMSIVHVDENANVFLHISENQQTFAHEVFYKLLEQLSSQIDEDPEIECVTNSMEINTDLYYIAKFNDGLWYRCRVTNISDDNTIVSLDFVDYGNTQQINLSNPEDKLIQLNNVSDVLPHFPVQCVKAALYHVVSKIPHDLGDSLIGGSVLVKVVEPAENASRVPVVELFKRSEDETLFSVNKELGLLMRQPKKLQDSNNNRNLEFLKKSQSSNYDISSFPSISNFPSAGQLPKPKIPEIGRFFDVNIPNAINPWNFFVQPYIDGHELKLLMCNLQDFYNRSENATKLDLIDIRPGEIYAAKHTDGFWYRACVSQTINDESISAFFVDFGSYVVLKCSQIVPLISKFKIFPYQAIKARLAGVSPCMGNWTVDDCCKFQKLVLHRQFVAQVKEIGQDVLHSKDIVLSVKLIDTMSSSDVHIDQLLFEQGCAIPTRK